MMYEFPYGAGQQINLNWIINEIITLHKRLDPDWELPNFDNAFPYMNLNQLNLDWILRELKAIKDLAPAEDTQLLKMVANALIANTYDAETQYNVDDIVYRDNDNRLYKCITATPAGGEAWNRSKWVEIDVGEVLTDLLVNGGTANAVTNVRYNNHKIQKEINGTYSDVITIEDAPTDASDRLPSSKAVYNLNGAVNDLSNKMPSLSVSSISIMISTVEDLGDFQPIVASCDSAVSKLLNGHQSTGIVIFKGAGTRIDYECFTPSDGNIAIGTIVKSSGNVSIINSYGNGVKTSAYAGRKISIIGDSISTFDQTGYKIDGYAMYYPNATVAYIDQTWWYKAMMMSGASIEVNASYSNSRVTAYSDLPDFYERCSLLGNPETIFVELGTNDSTNNVDLGNYDFTTAYQSLSETTFRTAYIKGIKALQATYPNAEICAVILKMDNGYASSIKTICKRLNVRYFECNDYASSDQNQRHPNVLGMRQIASAALTDTKQNVEKTCFYLPAYTNRQFNGFGYLTNDAKEVRMNFPCVTPNISDITLTKADVDACICSLRFGDATYVGGTYDYGIYANSDSISITIQSGGQGLRISFIKNSTWANASYNNMPIVGQITIRFKVDI